MNDASPPPPLNFKQVGPYPPYPYPPYQTEDDEISLIDIWRKMLRYKAMIISITLLTTLAAIGMAFTMTPIYRSEVLMASVSDDEQNSISTLANRFGSLASFAGIKLGTNGNSNDQALATLTSRSFIEKFIRDKKLMPILFSNKWDSESKSWKSSGFFSKDAPTLLDAYQLFHDNILDLNANKGNGLVTLAIEWREPHLAAQWANELVQRINQYEQQAVIVETEKSIKFLNDQLEKTSAVELRQAMYHLIESQTKTIMLANTREQYAFKVIDPAVVPEKRIRPKRLLIVALGLAIGLVMSVILATIMASYSKSRMEGNKYT